MESLLAAKIHFSDKRISNNTSQITKIHQFFLSLFVLVNNHFSGSRFSQKVPLKSGPSEGFYGILMNKLFGKKDKHPNFERDIVT